MQGLKAELLKGCWYMAAEGASLKTGALKGMTLAGEPVLLARGTSGEVFAMRDTCPHRGIPLRYGSVQGDTVQCCYHGWRFGSDGTCVDIPSMREGQQIDLSKIRCSSYPAIERYGLIWVYVSQAGEDPSASETPEPPALPDIPFGEVPKAAVAMDFPCSADHAAFGLMDPTHAAFVHTSWWFKKDASKLRPKEKAFEPSPFGFRMKRHRIPPQNVIYKRLLGDNVSTEISYMLPGYRIEHIRGDKHWVVGLTSITPTTDEETIVSQIFWSSIGWLSPVAPIARHFMRVFVRQDRDVVVQQREGLKTQPKLMLINDADTQARWWMRLKDEWMSAQANGRAFVNPLKEHTLRWRS
ncbi:Phenylpropionate dioxygenase, large terminal subunit [Faunimonas pinastri]|uniref:Phenylpropionate dioxygenase, large terminal subunit n=1 Tax=Faunimonas pinastri TaxID=1855383 RepID=A0A1H9GZR0_9HYPH|nr:aromatic ring-hydroxylating dioxygenase subunit alpha [Faunimonas pinastri]SEQ55468.1 Phenylpropionate dioxygenase, large terminal subunit [Faunimonas pinastri]